MEPDYDEDISLEDGQATTIYIEQMRLSKVVTGLAQAWKALEYLKRVFLKESFLEVLEFYTNLPVWTLDQSHCWNKESSHSI